MPHVVHRQLGPCCLLVHFEDPRSPIEIDLGLDPPDHGDPTAHAPPFWAQLYIALRQKSEKFACAAVAPEEVVIKAEEQMWIPKSERLSKASKRLYSCTKGRVIRYWLHYLPVHSSPFSVIRKDVQREKYAGPSLPLKDKPRSIAW